MTSKGWTEQELTESIAAVQADMRLALERGRLVREECDHNHPDYNGISNKRIKIAAAKLTNNPDISYDDAWVVMVSSL